MRSDPLPADASAPPAASTFSYEWDPRTDRLRCDRLGAELLGLDPDVGAATRETVFARVHRHDREPLRGMIAALSPARPTYRARYRFHPTGGGERVLEEHGLARFDAAGTLVGLLGICADVTEIDGAELGDRRAQREREARLRGELAELEEIYAAAPVGLCVLDREGRFKRVNDCMAELNGAPAAAHIGRTVAELAPDLAAQAELLAARVIARAEPVRDIELQGETPARPGEPRIWLESWLPITDDAGEVSGINIVAQEITLQRRVEARLAESEARFRNMAETVPDILFTADREGRCDYINARFYEITGLRDGSVLGMDWVETLHPDDRDGLAQAWSRSVELGRDFVVRYRLRCVDGAYRWFEARARPIRDERGQVARWFGVASDIDDLVSAREELEEMDRRKNEFLAILGHELRNPMAPVRNAVEIMASIAPEDPKLCWAIGVVDRQSRQMARLLDDLLDVSRIVCGKLALDLRRCPLAAILESAVDAARPLIAARGHRFDLELPDEPLYLEADSTRLAQVLTNLLNNAALYTPDGGRIRLCAQGQDERILIRIIDNGEGIAPELRARLFEAFTQGPRPLDRAPGGLGLGLVIAARLTTLHGGHIEAHSDGPGQGAEFRLSLPRTAPESAARVPAAHAEQPIAAALKILVVDDNAEVAQGMAALLEHLGQQVAVALSGVEAIAIAPRFSPRLVLIDFGMAGMDGFETAQRLRTLEPDPQRMRLVGVSGYSDAHMQEMGRRAGLDQQLIKPVGRDILAELLRRIAASSPPGAPPPDRIGT